MMLNSFMQLGYQARHFVFDLFGSERVSWDRLRRGRGIFCVKGSVSGGMTTKPSLWLCADSSLRYILNNMVLSSLTLEHRVSGTHHILLFILCFVAVWHCGMFLCCPWPRSTTERLQLCVAKGQFTNLCCLGLVSFIVPQQFLLALPSEIHLRDPGSDAGDKAASRNGSNGFCQSLNWLRVECASYHVRVCSLPVGKNLDAERK